MTKENQACDHHTKKKLTFLKIILSICVYIICIVIPSNIDNQQILPKIINFFGKN
jgi:hypothetical protein